MDETRPTCRHRGVAAAPAGALYEPSSPRWSRSTASPAEEYHQNYLEKNPGGYCHIDVRSADAFAERMGLEEGRACVQVDGLCEPLALGEGAATAGAVEREDMRRPCRVAQTARNEDGLADADVDALIREAG
ncbi:MAG: hypothetical protein ACLR3C_17400 [Eggerthella lenta]